MRRLLGSGIFILIMLLLDLYVFQAVKLVSQTAAPKMRILIYILYWSTSVVAVSIFLFGSMLNLEQWPRVIRTYLFAILIGLFIAKFIAAIFFLTDDIRRILQWGGGKIYYQGILGESFNGNTITRSTFMSWLGLGIGSSLFGALMLGFGNKYRYQLNQISMGFNDLPQAFKGLRVVHISDIHSGSFT